MTSTGCTEHIKISAAMLKASAMAGIPTKASAYGMILALSIDSALQDTHTCIPAPRSPIIVSGRHPSG